MPMHLHNPGCFVICFTQEVMWDNGTEWRSPDKLRQLANTMVCNVRNHTSLSATHFYLSTHSGVGLPCKLMSGIGTASKSSARLATNGKRQGCSCCWTRCTGSHDGWCTHSKRSLRMGRPWRNDQTCICLSKSVVAPMCGCFSRATAGLLDCGPPGDLVLPGPAVHRSLSFFR
jgi:hypothetical protein